MENAAWRLVNGGCMKELLLLVIVLAVIVIETFASPDNFCIRVEEAQFTTYPISDYFSDEYPAIRYRGLLYPFEDNLLYDTQPYIRVWDGEARWAAWCQE
jgi:hypothetical protein